jgi:hypothetical protein
MDAGVTMDRRSFQLRSAAALLALLLAFAIGAISGYAAKSMTTRAAAPAQPAATCPPGTHLEVWYTAGAWGCVSNPPAVP